MKNSVSLLIIMTALAGADTLLVPSEYPSIQNAISAAQNGDTVLVSPGEYGGPISFQGKNIVVLSTHGADDTLIRTFMDYHCVSFTGGEDSTAVLDGFTVRNQIFDESSSGSKDVVQYGGGVYIYESSPTVRNCIIDNCVAGKGAGVYMDNTSARIIDCTISNNELHASPYRGAGVFAGRSRNGVPPIIQNCDIHSNTNASDGGGIHIEDSFVKIINNNIYDNYSDHQSGGINVWGGGPEILSNSIVGNDGGSGGGVFIGYGIPTIIGNLIAENTAGLGGGIYEASGSLICIENNTIAMNTASQGGGLRSSKDSIFITNTVFWNNSADIGSQISLPATINESSTYISYCDIQNGQDSIYLGPIAILNWGPGNIDIDPLFETGPLGDYHLSMSSSCVDAGNPSSEYDDPEDPFNPGYALWPAMGYLRNDMGAFGGSGINYWLTLEEEESSSIQGVLSLRSFPNPFSSSCTVCYQLDETSLVNLSVYDLSGRLVKTLLDATVPAGMYSEYFDASDLCSGMYLIRLVSGDVSTSRRCIVIR